MTSMPELSTILLIAIPLGILQLILVIAALVSIIKKQVPTNDKLIWVILVVFVATIGPILYFAIGSNQLDQKVADSEDAAQ